MHFYRKNDHPLLKQFINSIILRRARIQIKYIQQYNYFYNIFLNKNYINSFFYCNCIFVYVLYFKINILILVYKSLLFIHNMNSKELYIIRRNIIIL